LKAVVLCIDLNSHFNGGWKSSTLVIFLHFVFLRKEHRVKIAAGNSKSNATLVLQFDPLPSPSTLHENHPSQE
jgi:hypothetical protein